MGNTVLLKILFFLHKFFYLFLSGRANIGKFDRIWDRGALVAINPGDRKRLVIWFL